MQSSKDTTTEKQSPVNASNGKESSVDASSGKQSPVNTPDKKDGPNIDIHKPFEYVLIDSDHPDEPITFYGLGCTEDDNPGITSQIAELMKKNAGKDRVRFGILGGDNNHHHGVDSRKSKLFKTLFDDVFKDMVFFNVLGNHDVDAANGKVNFDKAGFQIERTFVNPETGEWDAEKIKIFSSRVIDLARLRKCNNKWNMPGRYGVYHILQNFDVKLVDDLEKGTLPYQQFKHADLFFLDTNTFIKDFFTFYVSKTDAKNPNNQAAWFFKSVAKSQAAVINVIAHHPLKTDDKRNIFSDLPDYFIPTTEEWEMLEKAGIPIKKDRTKIMMSELLYEMMFVSANSEKGLDEGPGPRIDKFFVAHTHAQRYYSNKSRPDKKEDKKPNKPLTQVTLGAGGGTLQYKHLPHYYKETLCAITGHGYGAESISFDGNNPKTKTSMRSLKAPELVIVNNQFVKNLRTSDAAKLEKMVMSACEEFQEYLSQNPFYDLQPKYVEGVRDGLWNLFNFSDQESGKVCDWLPDFFVQVDHLINYFNQENIQYDEALEHVKNVLENCKEPNPNDADWLGANRYSLPKWVYMKGIKYPVGKAADAYLKKLELEDKPQQVKEQEKAAYLKKLQEDAKEKYLKTLVECFNKLKEIFDKKLQEAFGISYAKFIAKNSPENVTEMKSQTPSPKNDKALDIPITQPVIQPTESFGEAALQKIYSLYRMFGSQKSSQNPQESKVVVALSDSADSAVIELHTPHVRSAPQPIPNQKTGSPKNKEISTSPNLSLTESFTLVQKFTPPSVAIVVNDSQHVATPSRTVSPSKS